MQSFKRALRALRRSYSEEHCQGQKDGAEEATHHNTRSIITYGISAVM